MGKRSGTETIAAIYQAFLASRTWKQIDLARAVGVEAPALRRHLAELTAKGVPLTSEVEHPHVYWSVPKGWFPGGVAFGGAEVPELLRLVLQLPGSRARERLLRRVIDAGPRPSVGPSLSEAVVTEEASDEEEHCLASAWDSRARRVVLVFKYFSASRGDLAWRRASVQRVVPERPARFMAVCHRDDKLKWFRVDRVEQATLDEGEPYRAADLAQVEAMLSESVDGFHQGGAAAACSFVVKDPASRWVRDNLPAPMAAEVVAGGMRFSATTAGLPRLARFVVGLGAEARAETPELAKLVEELARGALEEGEGRGGKEG